MQDRREQVDKQEFFNNLIDSDKENVFFDRNLLSKHETLKRINQKFNSIYLRYHEAIDKDILFFFCEQIITEFVKDLDRDYLLIAKKKDDNGKYADDISTILVMMDTRIQRMIDEWRGTYKEKKGKEVETHTAPFFESFFKPLGRESDGNGWYSANPATFADVATEKNNMLYHAPVDHDEVHKNLEEIYKKAKLTDRQIEILEALEQTPDNLKGDIYNKAIAAEILNMKESSVRKAFFDIKKKIKKAYPEKPSFKLSRVEKIKKYEDFLDTVDDEKDVISFILDELNTDDMEYMLYKVEGELRQYFIINFINKYNKDAINNKKTRKFCRYFLADVYHYINLLKYNDFMNKQGKSVTVSVSIYMEGQKGKDGANYFF